MCVFVPFPCSVNVFFCLFVCYVVVCGGVCCKAVQSHFSNVFEKNLFEFVKLGLKVNLNTEYFKKIKS